MSDTSYAFTDKLKLAQTKKIVNECLSLSSWKDVLGGEGGGIVNEDAVKIEVNCKDLSKLVLPNIASFTMSGERQELSLPTATLLGGDDFSLPPDTGYSWVYIKSNFEQKPFIQFQLKVDNGKDIPHLIKSKYPKLRYKCREMGNIYIHVPIISSLSQSASVVDKSTLEFEFLNLVDFLNYLGFSCITFSEFVNAKYHLPLPIHDLGVLESYVRSDDKEIVCSIIFATSKLPQWKNLHYKAQEWMLRKNLAISSLSFVDYGGQNWFHGFTSCVTQQAYELIRHEAANPQYENYKCRYMTLEPETWPSREKRRKKLTKPIYQQLGECTLENGVKLTLRLKIVKDGYVIYLDFPNDDDMLLFQQSTLYRMSKWHCGAE